MAGRPRLTSGNVKRMIGVAKVVVPVVAPLAIQAAAHARHRWDLAKARRLGVPVDQLPSFTGKGAMLHARLAALAGSLYDLGERRKGDVETTEYVASTEARLADLAAAVRAAELMPTARRRAAHQAVARELDELETKLLGRLGV